MNPKAIDTVGAGSDPAEVWRFRNRVMPMGGRTRVMGILNVTPDSFSDGGRWADPDSAVTRAGELLAEGADLVDIGGESTRPGAAAVEADEEARRVVPVIRAVRAAHPEAVLSVDTRKARVAARALEAGADIVNDVSALGDPDMPGVVREARAGLVLMHMQGDPATMQRSPVYRDVVTDVCTFLAERRAYALDRGLSDDRLVLDPGIGFGKTAAHTLSLLRGISAVRAIGRPVLVGVSRKSVVEHLTGRPVEDRLAGSLALLVWLVLHGISLVRVHDVKASVDAVNAMATMEGEKE